jgi:3-deoxy-D-manno-octulosonic-acid transferase
MYLFVLGIRISALWNPKSRQWLRGRNNWDSLLHNIPEKRDYRIWFHVSSLGEFEQARPVIEQIKELRPGTEIYLSFFSPSGFEQKYNYEFASVLYLPADLPGNAKKWLNAINPDFAVFVKYDLWPGYLNALSRMGIPAILISAHWVPGFGYSSWSNPLTRNLLKDFRKIFLQRGDHLDQLHRKGFQNISVSGDTRIDRARKLPEEVNKRLPYIILRENFDFDIVAGSTWPEDEELLIATIMKLNLKTIIAPHDISAPRIDNLLKKISIPSVRLSELKSLDPGIRVLVIDQIGLLSVLYALGKIAYIGGGFGKGIHNSLEAMAHGKPVIFGPNFRKFNEAIDMVALKGAWSIHNKEELIHIIQQLMLTGKSEEAGLLAKQYIEDHSGATSIVTDYIMKSIPYIA